MAVVGIGQSDHARVRRDVWLSGLVREAAERALADAELDWAAIDAVVVGTGPDQIEGVLTPELLVSDGLGVVGKPVLRAYTSGNAGGVAADLGCRLVWSGEHRRVLVVAFEKQSEADAIGASLQRLPFEAAWQGATGSLFAAVCRAYIDRWSVPGHIGDVAALRALTQALANPFAHVKRPGLTLADVAASRPLWEPIRLLHASPSSDGACAVVLADEATVGRRWRTAWVLGCGAFTEPPVASVHDAVDPAVGHVCARSVYAQAGVTDPARDIDVAELFVPFSWLEPVVLENVDLAGPGQGWRMVDRGDTAATGRLAVNPSGGLLGANPVGAAGLIRFAEAALQVRGDAGAHQVDRVRVAVGHAAGGFSNCVAMWVVGARPPQ